MEIFLIEIVRTKARDFVPRGKGHSYGVLHWVLRCGSAV
jgi:hypothetical protein